MNSESGNATILRTGPGSSIQDLGRTGMARFGIPLSGAMDKRSMRWINHLLKNQDRDAVLEISQPGFVIQFDLPTHISVAGATAAVKLNQDEIPNPTQIRIRANDILEIGAFKTGSRIYLGIRHGFQTAEILGSRSFYNGLTERSQLAAGDKVLYFRDSRAFPTRNAKAVWDSGWFCTDTIGVYPGPDFPLLGSEVSVKLFQQTFTISNLANRMGIQLVEIFENSLPELSTNPVFPGTVQLTSGGKLMILLQDAQVTGGYPRILQLDEESQDVMAQKKPGDQIQFSLISE